MPPVTCKLRRRFALRGADVEYEATVPRRVAGDLDKAFAVVSPVLKRCIDTYRRNLNKSKAVKIQLRLQVQLTKFSFELNKTIYTYPWFVAPATSVITTNHVRTSLRASYQFILGRYDAFVHQGSGWELQKVLNFSLGIYRFNTFKGGCSTTALPKVIANKHACISLKCKNDKKCFLYAVCAAIVGLKRKNPQRISKEYDNVMNSINHTCCLKFPVGPKEIAEFEKRTPISVNVYSYDKVIFPFYVTEHRKKTHHVNLLLLNNHYWPIKSMSALISGQTRNNKAKHYVCNYCLCYFSTEKRYHAHCTVCKEDGQCYQLPKNKDKYVRFKNFQNMVEAPFVIYADLESYIMKKKKVIHGKRVKEKGGKKRPRGKTISKAKHVAMSAGAMAVCRPNPTFSSAPYIFSDSRNCIDNLLTFLDQQLQFYMNLRDRVCFPMKMYRGDVEAFKAARCCYMCGIEFAENITKCRDHCHLSGRYRGALCNTCNLTYASLGRYVYVVFHGLSNYDSHFLVQKLHKYRDRDIRIIPKSSEKYLTFSVGDIQFKDSFQFLGDSLNNLAKNLSDKGDEYFTHVNRYIPKGRKRELMKRKGVFPYTYVSSPAILCETKLPPRDCFKNDLQGDECISQEEYDVACEVWQVFGCKTLKDYMEVYLKADILLLADVFENFRTQSLNSYGLDPCYYFSVAHFTFDSYLKFSKVTFELLTDINKYLFVSEGIRGGVSMVSHRKSNAFNKYTGKTGGGAGKYILYLDANNLYGYSMSQYLPYADFQWVENEEELDPKYLLSVPEDSDCGYIVEASFRYPTHLHDHHVDFPLAPRKEAIPYNRLSPFAQRVCDKHNLRRSTNTPKLMTTLDDKSHYILHYRNFQLYAQLGLVVTHVHRAIRFRQAPIMKSYIEFNTKKRMESTNSFDVAFYKLLSNGLFGKTMERPENREKVELISSISRYEKVVSKPTFKSCKIIHKNLVSAQMKYASLKLNKPMYIGMVVLDLAKLCLYNFHYNVMKKYYGERLKLLYTDTDSLMYEITTVDLYKDLEQFKNSYFDFSNYPTNHDLYSEKNRKTVGFFRDEMGGRHITCFVGLRSKMYTFLVLHDPKEYKVAKGVKKYIIEHHLKYNDYLHCLQDNECLEADFKSIQSHGHIVHTVHQSKVSLCPFDDKRYLLNAYRSVPYGHYSLP